MSTPGKWKIELHGGGRRHKWREVGQAASATVSATQLRTLIERAKQGGVRVLSPEGIIAKAYWRKHAPGAKPEPIKFCIGCGCDDFHACVDGDTGGACYWLCVDQGGPHGVCSCCSDALDRWDAGDRKVPA